jgi:hypothetical protein
VPEGQYRGYTDGTRGRVNVVNGKGGGAFCRGDMKIKEKRTALKAVGWSLGLTALLLSVAAVGRWHREIRGCYYGVRLAASGDTKWGADIWVLGRAGAPGCRLAYRLSSDPKAKEEAAAALGICTSESELAAFVKEVGGRGTPAEKALLEALENHLDVYALGPPEGSLVLQEDADPPPNSVRRRELPEKTTLRYIVGEYEVELRVTWGRGFSAWGGPGIKGGVNWGPWRAVGRVLTVSCCDDRGESEVVHKVGVYGKQVLLFPPGDEAG